MKISLIYDEHKRKGQVSWIEAEYETPETIDTLLRTIKIHCDKVVGIPFKPEIIENLKTHKPDLAFNIAEGRQGTCRESIIPIILEHLSIPYTGSDGVTLGISLNKALTKRIAAQAGIRTPAFQIFESSKEVAEFCNKLRFPVLVKPNFGGSSIGISLKSVVYEIKRLPELVSKYLSQYKQSCLVEQYICGQDITVGLLGNKSVEVLPPGRVVTRKRVRPGQLKKKVICPYQLPKHLHKQITDWSLEIYKLIGAQELARIDYIVDENDQAYFLEINPLPGLSPYYGIFPLLAATAGYSYTDLIGAIINFALKRNLSKRR